MTTNGGDRFRIDVPGQGEVSALLMRPSSARAGFVFAHGAGAGMDHPFMERLALALAELQVATLRFQFPSMERGSKRVDPPAVAKTAVRAALDCARQRLPGLPLFAGGKSFGGRMSSQAQSEMPLEDVRGLVFVGFPLHPADKPGTERADHLAQVACPMLFLQGTRDELARTDLLRGVVEPLAPRATVRFFDDADHSFHVRKSSGTSDEAVLSELAQTAADWMAAVAG
jgi:hypothetical protein